MFLVQNAYYKFMCADSVEGFYVQSHEPISLPDFYSLEQDKLVTAQAFEAEDLKEDEEGQRKTWLRKLR